MARDRLTSKLPRLPVDTSSHAALDPAPFVDILVYLAFPLVPCGAVAGMLIQGCDDRVGSCVFPVIIGQVQVGEVTVQIMLLMRSVALGKRTQSVPSVPCCQSVSMR